MNGIYTEQQQRQIIEVARTTVEASVNNGNRSLSLPETVDEVLQAARGNFVTLKCGPHLRGCIGCVEADNPLLRSVAEHAYAAAFRDPRFSPVSRSELDGLTVSVSILTPMQPLDFIDEDDLIRALRPGHHGLFIEKDARQATFLPAVWETLPSPAEFLGQLKLKAGLLQDEVPERAWTYTAVTITE